MKRIIAVCCVLAMMEVGSCLAAELESNWAMQYSAGMGITVSPAENANNFPHSLATSGELIYMVNDFFGLVPVAVSYNRLSFDRDRFADAMRIPAFAQDRGTGDAWSLSYTPGVYLEFPFVRSARIFTIIEAGIYHFESSVAASAISYHMVISENRFSLQYGTGVEFSVTPGIAVIARAKDIIVGKPKFGSMWFFSRDESTKYFSITCGMKFYL